MEKLMALPWPVWLIICIGIILLVLYVKVCEEEIKSLFILKVFLKIVITIQNDDHKSFRVYRFITRTTFMRIFKLLPDSLDSLCLTPEEREKFCRENFNWLSPNGYTYFLEKRGDDFFVIGVYLYSHDSYDLCSFVCRLDSNRTRGDNRDRVIVRKP